MTFLSVFNFDNTSGALSDIIFSSKKAVNFAEKNLGPEDGITQNLRNVFENAKVEVSLLC